jgi:hypothetical protein
MEHLDARQHPSILDQEHRYDNDNAAAMLSRLYIPFHLLILLPLLALAVPLTLFAILTTTLALLTLLARLVVVYLDLALALLTSWIPPLFPAPRTARKRRSRAPTGTPPRPAIPTAVFAPAAAVATPSPQLSRRTSRSDSHVSVVLGLGVAPDRDYEGIGGWQLVDDDPAGLFGDADAGDGFDDEAGSSVRPEPPAAGGAFGRQRARAGSAASAAGTVQRRGGAAASVEREDDGGYFTQSHGLNRPASGVTMTSLDDDEVNQHGFGKY